MNYAVYRCLYGEDFIKESINSIDPYVDKIFIFYDTKPWGGATSCYFNGRNVPFPEKFDNILDKIKELKNPKIELIFDHQENNINQFTKLINERILPNYPKPELFIIPEVDHVLRKDQLEGSIKYIKENNILNASTVPIELWKEPKYRIPERHRMCTIFWNMTLIDRLPETGRQANSKQLHHIPFYTHNLGFCTSAQVMYWKHLTALAFSKQISDDIPNEFWFEKWLTWQPNYNNNNLEISKGYEHYVTHAYEYDVNELPEEIKKKYGY